MTQSKQNHNYNNEQPFWHHVADLRRLMFFIVSVWLVAASTIHYYRDIVIPFLLRPLGENAPPLQFLTPLEPLLFILKIDFVGGLIVVLPIVIICAYQFVNPTPLKRFVLPLVVITSSSALAIVGAAYAYYVVVPIVLNFMNSLILPGTIAAFTASGFIGFLLSTSFLLVLIFQIPIVTVLGSVTQIINPYLFSKYRQNSYLAIFVATAVITPTTDIFTLFLVSLPAIVVTEVGVLIGKMFYKVEETLADPTTE